MTPTEPIALSVVVPVFNGAVFIADSVRALLAHLDRLPRPAELIVVDDGSTDATAAQVQQALAGAPIPAFLVSRERNQGKGAAIAAGMQSARGAHRIFVDADLAYPPEAIDAIDAALARAEIAIACRSHPESRLLLNPTFFTYAFFRHLVGRVFNLVIRLFLLRGIRDSQAGLKGFTAEAAERLFSGWLPGGFSFDLALLFRARRLHLSIAQVPVLYRALDEPTTVRFLRDTARMLRDLATIRIRLVGDRFERWGAVAGRRWALFGRSAGEILHAPAAAPTLWLLVGVGLIVLAVGRIGVASFTVPVAGWVLAIGAYLAVAWRADLSHEPGPPRFFRAPNERVWFLAILLLTAAARFLWLGERPTMEHGDSAECGLQGLALLEGRARDVFSFSPWYQTPYLSFVPYALSFLLFDVSVWSLRLPSAITGTLAVVPLYFLARRWFGIRAALFAGAMYAVSHAAVHFSRIGLWNIQVLFYELLAFAALLSGVRRRRALPTALAGVVTGLALYSYTGGRLIPVIAFLFLATEAWRNWQAAARSALFYSAGIAVTVVPLLLNYYEDPAVLGADRTSSVWVFAAANEHHVESTLGTTAPAGVLLEQVKRTLLGFVALGDTSTQYGTTQPLLSPATALLVLGGVLVALMHWRQARFRFLLLWLFVGLLLGSVLVLDPPSYTRLVMLFPVPYLFAAAFLSILTQRWRRRWPVGAPEAVALLVLVVAQSAAFNAAGYRRFNHDMSVMPREWDVLRVFHRLGDDYDYYLYTGPFMLADAPVFRLFASGTRAVSGFTESDLPARLPRDAVFILTPEFRRVGVEISERYPGAEREVAEKEGIRQVIVYRCTEENGCRRGRS